MTLDQEIIGSCPLQRFATNKVTACLGKVEAGDS